MMEPKQEMIEQTQLALQNDVEKAYIERQKLVDAAEITKASVAEAVARRLYSAVIAYQQSLPDEEDVAVQLVQFNHATTICVERIGYIGVNLIVFWGKDPAGKPIELIQHVNQLSFLLMVVPKPEPELPKRQIGFCANYDENVEP